MILQQFFSAGILFAMLGGVLGAVWASVKEHDTPFQFFIEAAVSAVAAAAVHPLSAPILALEWNVPSSAQVCFLRLS